MKLLGAQFGRFLVVGAAGYVVDLGVTLLLIELGAPAVIARVPGIGIAMVVTWLMNRSFTFASARARSVPEFLKYASVAAGAAFVNYFAYIALLFLGLSPVLSVTLATAGQALLSFTAYKLLVFRRESP